MMTLRTLDEAIHLSVRPPLRGGPPGFHRLCPGELSPRPRPLLNLPGLPDERWANDWHLKTSPVHALGCYLADDIRVAEGGYMFSGESILYQPDVVVPYIRDYIDKGITLPSEEVDTDTPVVVAFDRGCRTYGHF